MIPTLKNPPNKVIIYAVMNKNIRFDSDFTKQLYNEVSALQDMTKIDKPFISRKYIWAVWQKVYKDRFGCTRHYILPGEGNPENNKADS